MQAPANTKSHPSLRTTTINACKYAFKLDNEKIYALENAQKIVYVHKPQRLRK